MNRLSKPIKNTNLVSIIMPCFNEETTIRSIVRQVLAQPCVGELIIVDDCSSDSSYKILKSIQNQKIVLSRNSKNLGKGSCIIYGIKRASMPIIGIQDSDLEYNPINYKDLIQPIIDDRADVVYGSRFKSGTGTRILYYWHFVANKLLTNFCNIFTNLNMSDMETCFKFFRTDKIKLLRLREKGFGIEPEITIKLAALNCRFYEIPISYDGRTYSEGKKIRFKDGIYAIYAILFYGITSKFSSYNFKE